MRNDNNVFDYLGFFIEEYRYKNRLPPSKWLILAYESFLVRYSKKVILPGKSALSDRAKRAEFINWLYFIFKIEGMDKKRIYELDIRLLTLTNLMKTDYAWNRFDYFFIVLIAIYAAWPYEDIIRLMCGVAVIISWLLSFFVWLSHHYKMVQLEDLHSILLKISEQYDDNFIYANKLADDIEFAINDRLVKDSRQPGGK